VTFEIYAPPDERKDNPYLVSLDPEEFHELLSAYENFVEWCWKDMTDEQQALAKRVLNRLREADATHVCLDEIDEEKNTGEDDG